MGIDEPAAIGKFFEFRRNCPGCQKETQWGFTQMSAYIDGGCEECEYSETFGSWNEVIEGIRKDENMLNEEGLRRESAKVCNGTSWTWVRAEAHIQVWRCNACGQETKDNLTISGTLIYGPHYKPGWRSQ